MVLRALLQHLVMTGGDAETHQLPSEGMEASNNARDGLHNAAYRDDAAADTMLIHALDCGGREEDFGVNMGPVLPRRFQRR